MFFFACAEYVQPAETVVEAPCLCQRIFLFTSFWSRKGAQIKIACWKRGPGEKVLEALCVQGWWQPCGLLAGFACGCGSFLRMVFSV